MSPDARRLPVVRSRRVVLRGLSVRGRAALQDDLYALWSEFFTGLTQERFVATHLHDNTRVRLLYGADGELAGFANINVHDVRTGGRRRLIITSGAFTRRRYDAARPLVVAGVREALRIRLEHPGVGIVALPVATSPIAYRVVERAAGEYFPRAGHRAPPWIEAMLAEMARRRDLVLVDGDPWRVDFPARQRRLDVLRERSRDARNPAVAFYQARNPDGPPASASRCGSRSISETASPPFDVSCSGGGVAAARGRERSPAIGQAPHRPGGARAA